MKTTSKTTRRTAATSAPNAKRGNMKPAEIKPLVMAARKAYDRQSEAGLVDGESFDSWRHQQCVAAVGKPGITACNHGDFQPLLAHFQILAGDDASAFRALLKSGSPTDHAAPGDTHEARRQLAHAIAARLTEHLHLAETSRDQLLAEAIKDSTSADDFNVLMARKSAIEAKGKGPLTIGYLIHMVRQKTRRPDLNLGRDWQAGLAERCTAGQLDQIRSTLINRISAVEGTGDSRARNKSQRRSSR